MPHARRAAQRLTSQVHAGCARARLAFLCALPPPPLQTMNLEASLRNAKCRALHCDPHSCQHTTISMPDRSAYSPRNPN
eukprot:scaffold4204_cov140-Isochrysis_galbana.AAC.7